METTVVNLKSNTYDIYIGRNSNKFHFGNPFSHLSNSRATVKVETREQAIQAFKEWITNKNHYNVERERRQWIQENIHTLRNKTLGCFCKPQACHGDIYVEILNEIK